MKSTRILALIIAIISSAIVFLIFFSISLIKSNSSIYPTSEANFQIDLSPIAAISETSNNLHSYISDSSVSPRASPILISTHFNPPENTSGSEKIPGFEHKTRGGESLVKEDNKVIADLTSIKVIELRSSNNGEEEKKKRIEECDVTKGKWVYDSDYPLYTNASCPFIDEGFGCQSNGRLDLNYMKWRWEPQDCDAPRLAFFFLILS